MFGGQVELPAQAVGVGADRGMVHPLVGLLGMSVLQGVTTLQQPEGMVIVVVQVLVGVVVGMILSGHTVVRVVRVVQLTPLVALQRVGLVLFEAATAPLLVVRVALLVLLLVLVLVVLRGTQLQEIQTLLM